MEELLLSDDGYLQNDVDIGDTFFDALFFNVNPQEEEEEEEEEEGEDVDTVAQERDLIGFLTGRRHSGLDRATSSVEEEELYELAQ